MKSTMCGSRAARTLSIASSKWHDLELVHDGTAMRFAIHYKLLRDAAFVKLVTEYMNVADLRGHFVGVVAALLPHAIGITTSPLIADHVLGWRGVTDEEGRPLPFDRPTLEAVLDVRPVGVMIVRGLLEASGYIEDRFEQRVRQVTEAAAQTLADLIDVTKH